MAQVGLDQTLGGAIMTIGYFTFHTLFSAALAGQVFPLPTLWSSIQKKVTSRINMVDFGRKDDAFVRKINTQ